MKDHSKSKSDGEFLLWLHDHLYRENGVNRHSPMMQRLHQLGIRLHAEYEREDGYENQRRES